MQKVILVEFNELCPGLLSQWMKSGDLPNFKRLHDCSDVYISSADEEDPNALEPWIQWYSIHTGLPFSTHRVFNLTDGPKAGHPDIWSLLHDGGKSVWNCSSMNARQFSYHGSAYLPDPWCTSETPHPKELEVFHRFVGHHVREYSNTNQKLGVKLALEFVLFMSRNGLRLSTIFALLRQYISEVLSSGKTRWQRVALQDRFLFDMFSAYFRRLQPTFSTFFANSTAHLQHSHWRHMDAAIFTIKPNAQELTQYKDAILFGYQQMDRLLGNMMKLAGPEARIIFATGLSQQPYLKHEHLQGQNFYRPHSINDLLSKLGVMAQVVQSVMTHQFLAHFENQNETDRARYILESLTLDGNVIFGFGGGEPNSLYFGSQIHTVVSSSSEIVSSAIPEFGCKFFDIFYRIDDLKSGRHHPDGCLWIQSGKHRQHADKVSILDILPTICKLLNVPISGYVGRPLV